MEKIEFIKGIENYLKYFIDIFSNSNECHKII